VSRLGDIRADHDANCTYEGENNVLIQQASNWLLNQWAAIIKGEPITSPLNSADFLVNAEQILSTKFNQTTVEGVLKPESMIQILYCTKIYYYKLLIQMNFEVYYNMLFS
jgi:acyl-CoA oxidase